MGLECVCNCFVTNSGEIGFKEIILIILYYALILLNFMYWHIDLLNIIHKRNNLLWLDYII